MLANMCSSVFSCTFLVGLCSSGMSHAFVTNRNVVRTPAFAAIKTHRMSSLFSGWDNDDFLESLSSGNTAQGNTEEVPQQQQATTTTFQQRPPPPRPPQNIDAPLPPGWTEHFDPTSQQLYFHNAQDGTTTWQRPISASKRPPPPPPLPPPPPNDAPLPAGWTEHLDPASQQMYYYNNQDGTTTWQRPLSAERRPTDTLTQSFSSSNNGLYRTSTFDESPSNPVLTAPDPLVSAEEPDTDEQQDDVLPDDDIEGAQLTDEMKEKMKASHTPEEDASQGGEKFRLLMERAKQQQPRQQLSRPQPVSAATNSIQLPPNALQLPIEEQARLYRELLWRQEHPDAATQERPPPTYLGEAVGIDGRKIGRNREAEVIANQSDVYMAKLKRDSTVRNFARYAGNDAQANAVFADPSIPDIAAPEENPYRKEQRERERDALETVPEEMLLFQEYNDRPNEAPRKVVSYRDKLAEKKAMRSSRRQQD